MNHFSFNTPDATIFQQLKYTSRRGVFNGEEFSDYLNDCRWRIDKYSCIVIFSRDVGHHSSGWWKNPDYERCYHLSISFPGGRNKSAINKIIDGLFGYYKKLLWIEPPYSPEGKQAEVWHYRLFCDENWNPIKPRGEVYSKQFTELGWRSFSELNY